MIKIIFLAVVAYILYRLVKGVFSPRTKIDRRKAGGVIDEMVQDPFCGTYIPRRESIRRVMEGEEYLFCSEECADKFALEMKDSERKE
ncbi:MAG: YHS domain-containing protein [Desulfobacteraceae bacterium]|jgi:YHS domain-containing protein